MFMSRPSFCALFVVAISRALAVVEAAAASRGGRGTYDGGSGGGSGGAVVGVCTGGSFHCASLDRDQCATFRDYGCEVNPNKQEVWEDECTGDLVRCIDLPAYYCENYAPKGNEWGGCTYEKKNEAVNIATLSLASAAVALLLVTVFLLAKLLIRTKKVGDASAADSGGVSTAAEPLLGGTGA